MSKKRNLKEYINSEIVLSFQDHKQAALYFDTVIPINTFTKGGKSSLLSNDEESKIDTPSFFLPESLKTETDKVRLVQKIAELNDNMRMFDNPNMINYAPEGAAWCEFLLRELVLPLKKYASKNVSSSIRTNIPLLLPKQYYHSLSEETSQVNNSSLVVANMKLVDTEKSSWEQIEEFRKDKESKTKLARFRCFMHDSYADKPKNYIEDDINIKIQEYHDASNKHGFELVSSVLTEIIDSKTFLASTAAVFSSFVVGNLDATEILVASGLSIEVGKMTLKLAGNRYQFKYQQKVNDVAYIISAQESIHS